MEYSRKDIKRNVTLFYIANFIVGFQVGARDLGTTMQVLFNKVGGDSLLAILNQMTYYTIIICLFLVGINVKKLRLKGKVVFLEMATYTTYLLIAILLYFDKLTGNMLFALFFLNMLCNRLLVVLWMDFKMKIVPKEYFKKFLGQQAFLYMSAVMLGMGCSYYVIGMEYPINFVIILSFSFLVGMMANALYMLMREPHNRYKGRKDKSKVNFSHIGEIAKERNFRLMMWGKIILNISYGIVILYAMYALKAGYTPQQIVSLGMSQFAVRAMISLVIPKIKISSRQNMVVGHASLGLSILLTVLTGNFYFGFIFNGISGAFVNIGYFGYMNTFDEERKHVYLTVETAINFTMGLGIPLTIFLVDIYNFRVAAMVALIFVAISIMVVERLEEREEATIHIFKPIYNMIRIHH